MTGKFRTFFTVSIILNVLLLGALGGIMIDRAHYKPWEKFTKDLSPEAQNVIARTFQKSHREAKGVYDEMKAAKEEMGRVFSARTFDEKAFAAASVRMDKAYEAVRNQRHEAMKELAKELTQEDREKMAKRFAKGFGHHRLAVPRMYDHPPAPRKESE